MLPYGIPICSEDSMLYCSTSTSSFHFTLPIGLAYLPSHKLRSRSSILYDASLLRDIDDVQDQPQIPSHHPEFRVPSCSIVFHLQPSIHHSKVERSVNMGGGAVLKSVGARWTPSPQRLVQNSSGRPYGLLCRLNPDIRSYYESPSLALSFEDRFGPKEPG